MADIMPIHHAIAASHASPVRGQVWCRSCGSTMPVNVAKALAHGWPKCCGATMTIDSPAEQVALRETSHGG